MAGTPVTQVVVSRAAAAAEASSLHNRILLTYLYSHRRPLDDRTLVTIGGEGRKGPCMPIAIVTCPNAIVAGKTGNVRVGHGHSADARTQRYVIHLDEMGWATR